MRSERSDVRTGSQNAQVTPSDSRRGLPPAALKPSYSPRTAKAPSLHCTPAPAAKLVFVRLMGRNSGANRQEGQTRSRPALLQPRDTAFDKDLHHRQRKVEHPECRRALHGDVRYIT